MAVIWLHGCDAARGRALRDLGLHLLGARRNLRAVLSCDAAQPPIQPGYPQGSRLIRVTQPPLGTASGFLDQYQPALAIGTGRGFSSSILSELARRGIPALLLDGASEDSHASGWSLPGLHRRARFRHYTRILGIRSAEAGFRRAGMLPGHFETAAALSEGPPALPVDADSQTELREATATRPIWCAACVPDAELPALTEAHAAALNLSHRLLMILLPTAPSPERGAALAARLDAQGWTVARRSTDWLPAPETQILIADEPEELGLWYRLAPVSWLGGTLMDGDPLALPDPACAAALGSAVFHGPRTGIHAQTLGRLTAAGGARLVTATTLTPALQALLNPEITARMARAAWEVCSTGAPVTDRVRALAFAVLDGDPLPEARRATA